MLTPLIPGCTENRTTCSNHENDEVAPDGEGPADDRRSTGERPQEHCFHCPATFHRLHHVRDGRHHLFGCERSGTHLGATTRKLVHVD